VPYQVGHITDFTDGDPEFDRVADAIEHAQKLSCESDNGHAIQPYGVWTGQADGSELLHIVYGETVFSS